MKRIPAVPSRSPAIDESKRKLAPANEAPSRAPAPGFVACPAPREGALPRYRKPLWRPFS